MTVRVGLVGYGAGGRNFHTPFIQASPQCELVGVVTRSATRAAEVQHEIPGAQVVSTLAELIDVGVDVVVISTPPDTRQELVMEAVRRGVHVVADKPFAPTAELAQKLIAAADSAGVMLGVFHNRRWDTDLVTLRSVLDSNQIGKVLRFDSRFDLDQPHSLEAGPAGGLLRDLGSHLVDQALCLFGPAAYVSAQLDWTELPGGRTDSGFVISVEHQNGVHSHLSASKLNRLISRELRVLGDLGSYESSYTDVQAQAILAGRRPVDDRENWGYEDPDRWGRLHIAQGPTLVPSMQGDYTAYYDLLADAVLSSRVMPVSGREALKTLLVLDAARLSAIEHRTVPIADLAVP